MARARPLPLEGAAHRTQAVRRPGEKYRKRKQKAGFNNLSNSLTNTLDKLPSFDSNPN
jgi:hypothetical protein